MLFRSGEGSGGYPSKMSASAAARISLSVDGGVLTTSAAHRLICLSNFDAVFFHLEKGKDKS